ncbi:MAG: hypothetical protein GEU98_20700 [Pseudonocardiaceae bacterium]|nr:hypothetical protein [Pseudonocardiaceae bacterium]
MKKWTRSVIPAAIAAIAVAPLSGSASAAQVDENAVGPHGYQDLQLNMPENQANATGLLVDRQAEGKCHYYYLRPSEGKPHPGSGVFVSETKGVVMIGGTDQTHTPEGLGFGDHFAEVKAAHPTLHSTDDPSWVYTAPVPGNPDAQYRFAFSEEGTVSDFGLEAKDMAECGS